MKFSNRKQAGIQLAEKLEQRMANHPGWSNRDVLVVGLPRGGVPVALEVARRMRCRLNLLVAKKLPYPGQPEYAIGAVSSDGVVVTNPDIPDSRMWAAYIEQERKRLLTDTRRIEQNFYQLAGYDKPSFQNKIVIVIDDGIATGMTARAALESVRHRGAAYIILATPVISPDTYHELKSYCDEIVAISVPVYFSSVGLHYAVFDQTQDLEVVEAMRESVGFTKPERPAA